MQTLKTRASLYASLDQANRPPHRTIHTGLCHTLSRHAAPMQPLLQVHTTTQVWCQWVGSSLPVCHPHPTEPLPIWQVTADLLVKTQRPTSLAHLLSLLVVPLHLLQSPPSLSQLHQSLQFSLAWYHPRIL